MQKLLKQNANFPAIEKLVKNVSIKLGERLLRSVPYGRSVFLLSSLLAGVAYKGRNFSGVICLAHLPHTISHWRDPSSVVRSFVISAQTFGAVLE